MALRNVDTTVKDGKLIVTIDLAAKAMPSKSGNTQVVATTGGFIGISTGVPGGMVSLSLNLTKA
jgi:hypothetical protein